MKLRLALAAATCLGLPLAATGIAHAQPVTGAYVDLGAGYNLPNNTQFLEKEEGVSVGVPIKITGGLAATTGIGYGFGDGFRVALEVNYLHDNTDKFYNSYINDNDDEKLPGTISKYGALLNGYYDFDFGLPVYPYIGGGAGVEFTQYKSKFLSEEDGVSYKTGINPAIDFVAGVAYPIAVVPGLSLTAQYTFLDVLGNVYVGKFNEGEGDNFKFGFDTNMSHIFTLGLRYQLLNAAPMATPMAAAPAAAPAPMPAKTYLVFFDWDKYSLTPKATTIIAEAASDSKSTGVTTLDVSGYTDTSGTPDYNQGLSMRRAKAVEAKLIADGVPASEIEIHAYGETHLLVPTGPGVREPQNRRVEIVLQ